MTSFIGRLLSVALLALALVGASSAVPSIGGSTAQAEVRFGKGVRIGGHDFSNRRYKGVHIERTNKRPPWYGCRIYKAGQVYQGKRIRERTEICNLKRIPQNKRR